MSGRDTYSMQCKVPRGHRSKAFRVKCLAGQFTL